MLINNSIYSSIKFYFFMEGSFLEFELDLFRNFFSTAGENDNDFNNVATTHQKSILSPYSIGVCLCYLISMIKSNKIREKVAKELIGVDLKDFLSKGNSMNDIDIHTNSDSFLKEVSKLIYKVEDIEDTLSSEHDIKTNYLFSKTSNTNENNNSTPKRNFYSANLAFSVINPNLLSPESEFLQNFNFIKQIDYTSNSVYKIINKTVKRKTFGHVNDLMNPLMPFTDNSLALSSLLYFEDSFHEDNCFDSIEIHIFHTFTASNRRRKSNISGQKTIKCQQCEIHNLCLACHKNEQRMMTSSQSFTSLYQYSSSSVKVQMMKMTGKKPLCNDKLKNYFAIELPTSDSNFSLVCVIPRCRGEDSFTNMIQNMTIQEYRSILDNMEPSSFDICLPFFSFDTESFDLISPLSEFELDKIYRYNNELSNLAGDHFTEEEDRELEQKDPKKKKKNKKKNKKDKMSKEKRKKKSSSAKSSNKNNSDEHDDDIDNNKNANTNINTESNNENTNHNYFYCPHCGARKVRNESMIGKECMIKNIKLNEDAFLHHFRQKCHFSVNLNGVGQRIISDSLPRSNSISSLSSSSSVSVFDLNAKTESNPNGDYDKEKISHRDTKTKGKEKKKKDNQPKKIFDHPFIFFLTRRNPDIIIQYGVVTIPTLQDESFVL